ncbi:hypothetical protein JCM19233_2821 [Vibrio astriarenae]|nr:hypothetical protein JCM19233_2821 [Vibrio sp. C7]
MIERDNIYTKRVNLECWSTSTLKVIDIEISFNLVLPCRPH